jgi:hypothetical protein
MVEKLSTFLILLILVSMITLERVKINLVNLVGNIKLNKLERENQGI